MSLESLKLLEGKIGQFVDKHERVQQQHELLAQRLRDKEKQLAEAASQLKQYEQERGEIRARLERILSRLEGLNLA
jgi:septal ring factor EnvC (AmiA/AmiB activator)